MLMRTDKEIDLLVHDADLLAELIDDFPQTYKTILGEKFSFNITEYFLLRKNLNKLHKEGLVYKSIIPGTRHGVVLFYSPKKEYTIAIEGTRFGSEVYVFFGCKSIGKFYKQCNPYYVLKDFSWERVNEEKVIFLGNVLRWIQ
jgi:hypothetical protein